MIEGIYFKASTAQHQVCAEMTRAALNSTKTAEPLLSQLDQLLLLMDGFACCAWGCSKREHDIEYLVGRAVSYARATLRLVEIGHYDEANSLTRTIAEIGNLMWLFFSDTKTIREWIDASKQVRIRNFSPGNVRESLKKLNVVIPHDSVLYSHMCEVGVHPNPDNPPQAHTEGAQPTLGGRFQEAALWEILNLLSWAVASVAGPAAKLAILRRDIAEQIVEASINLTEVRFGLAESPLDESVTSS